MDSTLLYHLYPADPHLILGGYYIDRPPPTPLAPHICYKGLIPWDISLSPLDFYCTSGILCAPHYPTPEGTTLVAPSPSSPPLQGQPFPGSGQPSCIPPPTASCVTSCLPSHPHSALLLLFVPQVALPPVQHLPTVIVKIHMPLLDRSWHVHIVPNTGVPHNTHTIMYAAEQYIFCTLGL